MNKDIIIAMPVAGSNPLYVVSGSVTRVCAECQQPVYASPATVAMMQQTQAELLCVPCGMQHIEANGPTEFGVIPGQGEEIVRDISSGLSRHN